MSNLKKEKGFTIIEVMIVLAIAGLIMAVVFLAVPALQRNTRNSQRRSDASHLTGLVTEFASNHAGTLPTGFCGGVTTPAAACGAATLVDLTSEKFALFTKAERTTLVAGGVGSYGSTAGATDTVVLNLNAKCDASTGVMSFASNTKSFALAYRVETGGAAQNVCQVGS